MGEWITTSEAAARLGVKRATLYSYVSRGVLASRRMPGQAESLFDRAQVDALAEAKHDGRRAGSRLMRFRAIATKVSAISDDRLSLRGRDITEICAAGGFADAARFVVQVHDEIGPAERIAAEVPFDLIAEVPIERRIPLTVALVAARDPLRLDRADPGARVLALLPMLARTVPEIDLEHPWVDVLLTTLIDNGLAASTTAARVAASARAGVYDCLLAGYAALSGVLHGGAPVDVCAMIEAVIAGTDVDTAIADAVSGGRLPGFGHVVYRGDDPRAVIVYDRIRAERPDAPALAAAEAIRTRVPQPMNVDLMSAVVTVELGLPPRTPEVLFQYARTVGMTAHIAEEYTEAPLRWRGSNSAVDE
ncbi:citrate synthase [Gordonia sp. (in: high G+C Gram-positive bacteria)]|uniref:citrate synthase n=1 Tax=Gordonia sp. (in: high G+C Gram-positive bacteria) TaxID=84139 RepID=UPI00260B1622|nr:citrate synthase [Gordonia sp. (in: high G+C Gram-positive bacteria)]